MTTLRHAGPQTGRSSTASRASGSDSGPHGRFVPGTIVADRYRMLGLLGRGGMGEVYRADDLKLSQTVALKFLPEALARDEGRLARFFNEVRTARQISHPNICRVHDVGEIDGHHFLTMEYVDGEDLASLLRRVGHLPRDRAIRIARQLCAGLAAAHDQGILHRDLKPANVMIDSRGRARLTDFGLAAIAADIAQGEIRVGTPAYMAPEQLAGRQVNVRSDIYALGLVLYELFTGRPAFDSDDSGTLSRLQQESTPASPSSVVDGFDPVVERVILRCLESDPRLRPASAAAVAAALPGGDPLAAALAAGETPSPEMVADSGDEGGLGRPAAALCLLGLLAGLVGSVFVLARIGLIHRVSPGKPPYELAVEARQVIQLAGLGALGVADHADGFAFDQDYIRHVQLTDPGIDRWDNLGTVIPSPIVFWYRTSPRALVPANNVGWVSQGDPPPLVSGMVGVQLDSAGRLRSLLAVPPQLDPTPPSPEQPDWSPLMQRAGLEPALLTAASPAWNPPFVCDARTAWTGAYASQPDVPIRVEACSYRGRPAWFEVLPPWAKPRRMEEVRIGAFRAAGLAISVFLIVSATGAAVFFARRNLILGRGDRLGATRLSLLVLVAVMVSRILRMNHVAEISEFLLLIESLARSLLIASICWLLYIAVEPYVRRLWPDVLISWNRLLAGRLRDPRIGRDILIGGLVGMAACLALGLSQMAEPWVGQAPSPPLMILVESLDGARSTAALWFSQVANVLGSPMALLFVILLLRVLLRREWVAVAVLSLLLTTNGFLSAIAPEALATGLALPWLALVAGAALIFWLGIILVLTRLGLFACVVLFFYLNLGLLFPLTFDASVWYAGSSWAALAAAVGLAVYGFVIASR